MAEAMRRNIDEAAETTTIWKGKLESKTIICPFCGKPAGTGKFCNNCGASMDSPVRQKCQSCGEENPPRTKFCGGCGGKL